MTPVPSTPATSMHGHHKVLVFPCGSECGLEIGRSLDNLKEVELWGGSSVDDHGRFAFRNYIGNIPHVKEPHFIDKLNSIITQHGIDFIFPAMDSVSDALASAQSRLSAQVIGSSAETTNLVLSKKRTYERLSEVIRCPRRYDRDEISDRLLPLFLKPEIGYGAIGTLLAKSLDEVDQALANNPSLLILENLPGEEFTVDCFTNNDGELLFCSPRSRRRIARGISVNTVSVPDPAREFRSLGEAINSHINFNGTWFFQVKRDSSGELALLEVAARVAGSVGLQRAKGVNLPLLSVLNQAGIKVGILENSYNVEFDRAFGNRAKVTEAFGSLYLDFDDCLLLNGSSLNADAVKLIIQFRNEAKPVHLITRHSGELNALLKKLGILGLFDSIIHLTNREPKSDFMQGPNPVFIDDSYSERYDASRAGIPSLGPEGIELLFR